MVLLVPSPHRELDPNWRLGETPHELALRFSEAQKLISRATGHVMSSAHEAHDEDEGIDSEMQIRPIYDTLECIFGLDHGEDQSHQPGIPGFQSTSGLYSASHPWVLRSGGQG
jgi:hypothetical protein